MKDARSSVPSAHVRSKRVSIMLPYFWKPLSTGLPTYTCNIAVCMHTHTYTCIPIPLMCKLFQVSLDYFFSAGLVASHSWHLKAWSLPKWRSIEVRRWSKSSPHLVHCHAAPWPGHLCSLFIPLPGFSLAFPPMLLAPWAHKSFKSLLLGHVVLQSTLVAVNCPWNEVNNSALSF